MKSRLMCSVLCEMQCQPISTTGMTWEIESDIGRRLPPMPKYSMIRSVLFPNVFFCFQNGVQFQSRPTANHSLRNYLTARFNKIMTSCTVLRIGDFVVHRVTSKKDLPKEFIKGQRSQYQFGILRWLFLQIVLFLRLPTIDWLYVWLIAADKERYKLPETEIIHAEFTYYYYPGDIQFPREYLILDIIFAIECCLCCQVLRRHSQP